MISQISKVIGESYPVSLAFDLMRESAQVREHYNEDVTAARDEVYALAKTFHDRDECFGEEVARRAFELRDTVKKAHQEQTWWPFRIGIAIRNYVLYGAPNATFESLSRTKNPEQIAYSSLKTDGSDLGLKGNGYNDVLATWEAIREYCTLYPEDITPEMVAVYKSQPPGKIDPAAILAVYPNWNSDSKINPEVQHLVAQAAGALSTPVAEPALVSADDLMAYLTHPPRRNYAYM